jgi:Ca2+-binding RTX toxin-like protein
MVREDLAFSRAGDDLVIALRGSADRLTVRDRFLAAQSLLGSSNIPRQSPSCASPMAPLDRAVGALVDATGSRDDDAAGAGAGGEGVARLRLVGRAQDVHGGDGDDSLAADPHLPDDTSRLYGDAGNDVLIAGRGYYAATLLSGGSGDDVLHGASSATLDGGSGRNRLVIGNGPADDVFAAAAAGGSLAALPAGSRPQQLVLARDGGADYVTQQDTSLGSGRHDAFTVRMSAADYRDLTVGRDRDDLILGVRGRDARMTIADFFAAGAEHAGMQGLLVVQDDLGFAYLDPASPTADALAARAQPIAAAAVESSGTAGDDDLVGAGNADQLRGMAGDDRLDGLSGDDVLAGGDGDDVLIGRSGDDRLAGDDGDDTLIGGDGDDDLAGGEGADSLADAAGANRLDGGAGADTLRASGGSNALHGGDGDDLIVMLAGANAAEGGAGDDRINFLGGSADIDGGTGDDRIALAGAGTVTVRFGRGAGRDPRRRFPWRLGRRCRRRDRHRAGSRRRGHRVHRSSTRACRPRTSRCRSPGRPTD